MKKPPPLLYIPLLLLLTFAVSVLVAHYARLAQDLSRESSEIALPFSVFDGRLANVQPAGAAAGLQTGDRIVAVGGQAIDTSETYRRKIGETRAGEPVEMTVEREMPGGEAKNIETTFAPAELKRDFNYYSLQTTVFVFSYVLPTFCVLLGFWVVFVRPRDFLAWLLLFILLGFSSGFDNAPRVNLSESTQTIERLRRNEPLVVYQDDADPWINEESAGAGERADLRALNSQLLLPVGAKNVLSGFISLSPKRSEESYTPNDLRLLKSVAAQTGLALENSRLTEAIASEAAQKERLNTEIEIAREVQERLFPQDLPPVEGLDYFGACRPALGVGGDYYDFIELPEGKFGIAVGDISGKGIGASLMMASLQASLRGQAIHFKNDLAGLMKQINSLVYEASTSNRYATFFYAQFDPKTKKLSYVNAGHNPPFLLRAGGEVVRLETGGAVVGMLPSMLVDYEQGEVQMQPGDLLVGYTDGISEALNPREEEWSEDAMLAELKTIREKPACEILPHVVACADRFAAGAKQHDDMTMIVVKVM